MGSLENATAVLRLLAQQKSAMTLTQIVNALEMPKSSASRLLKMMAEQGLLVRDPATSSYRPGLLLVDLGVYASEASALLEHLKEALKALCKQTGCSGFIALLDGRSRVILWTYHGSDPLFLTGFSGHRAPAHNNASGRVLLARRTNAQVRQLYARHLNDFSGQNNTPKNFTDLLARLDTIRKKKWALSREEVVSGRGSIACSVSDAKTQESYAFGLGTSTSVLQEGSEELEHLSSLMLSHAERIGRAIKDPFWD